MRCGLFLKEIEISDGTKVRLDENSILVITGPNNSGKSTLLREISHGISRLSDLTTLDGIVAKSLVASYKGEENALLSYILDELAGTEKDGIITLSGTKFNVSKIKDSFKNNNLMPGIRSIFYQFLSTSQRLNLISDRRDYGRDDNIIKKLNINEPKEIEISNVFRRAFGVDLILNRTNSQRFALHIGDRSSLPEHKERLTPKFQKWISSLETLQAQGDGMKSFAGIMLVLLVESPTLILIDEPETFLHPPQIRQLASVIAADTPRDTQVIIATHSDEFVRGILDVASDRVIAARMSRYNNVNYTKALMSDDIRTLWRDPLLRTSDVLASLFHQVSIVCEGDSDVRFLRALLDATKGQEKDPDLRLFHCGGKDRIGSIVGALKAVDVPVLAVVDIDILDDKAKFRRLFEAMGGSFVDVERHFGVVHSSVEMRRAYLSGQEIKIRTEQIISGLEGLPGLPSDRQRALSQLIRDSSPWRRPKEDGYPGLGGADAVASFRTISAISAGHGLLINPVGELEGFCRTVGRGNKSDWLANVMQRNLATDPELREARDFVAELRVVAEKLLKSVMLDKARSDASAAPIEATAPQL